MAGYDYKQGKARIQNILDNTLEVIEQSKLPNDDNFTFDNAYHSWVTAVFVDIRDSTSLCSNEEKTKVSKVLRSFTSEVIEILRDSDNLREIGIRGDCVYAIYTTPTIDVVYGVTKKAFYVNTFMKMLNKLLLTRNLPSISVGIGISTAQDLVIKAGRKNVGINSKVWIGKAVTKASNLSSLGNKNGVNSIVLSYSTYQNIISLMLEKNNDAKSWFKKINTDSSALQADIIISDFNSWILSGMPA